MCVSQSVSVAAEREAFEEPERDLHPSARLEEVQSLTGYIDEFRAWSTVRTSAEIKANYKVCEL